MGWLAGLREPIYAGLRILAGLMFALHGAQKLFGVLGGSQREVFSQLWIGGVIELVGGSLIALGLFTPWAAFVCSGMMAVAYFQFHQPKGFFPVVNKGESAILYCWIFLLVAAQGGGRFSLDQFRK